MIFKDYVRSAVLTFISGALMVIVPHLDTLTIADFRNGAIIGILFTGVRTGLKGVFEMYLVWYQSKFN